MKIDRIISDYKAVWGNHLENKCGKEETIAAYFGDSDEDSVLYTLADNSGEIALSEYTNFVSNSYFPIVGSWIAFEANISRPDEVAETKELRHLFNDTLINSRFYQTVTRMIREASAYKNATVDISDINGLNFDLVTGKDIAISPERGDSLKRAYAHTTFTVQELIDGFDGEYIN